MRMMSPAWAGTKVMGCLGGARGDIVGGFRVEDCAFV